LEQKILEMTERFPTFSYLRTSQEPRLVGVGVSPSATHKTKSEHLKSRRPKKTISLCLS
jgi:hypothetical protein